MADTARTPPRGSKWDGLVAFALFAAGFGALFALFGQPPVHPDTARDWLTARDCIELGRCHTIGPPASFALAGEGGRLWNGALWTHWIEACLLFGLGPRGTQCTLLAAQALSASLAYLLVRRHLGQRGGVGVWAATLAATAWCTGLPVQWNPAPLPLPVALFFGCLLASTTWDAGVVALANGLALGLAADTYPVGIALAPLMVATLAACSRRPVRALAVSFAGALAVVMAVSPGLFSVNRPLFVRSAPVSLAVLGSSLVAGGLLRPRAQSAVAEARCSAVMLASAACLLGELLLGSLLVGRPLEDRYLVPAVLPTVVALSVALAGLLRRVPALRSPRRRSWSGATLSTLALLASVRILVGLRPDGAHQGWRMTEALAVAKHLDERGVGFAQLFRHVRGRQAYDWLATAAVQGAPAAEVDDASPRDEDVVILLVPRGAVPEPSPPEWEVVDLDDTRVAVVRRAPSAIDASEALICVTEEQAPRGQPRCVRVAVTANETAGGDTGLARWAYPALRGAIRAFPPSRIPNGPGLRVSYQFALRSVVGSARRRVRMVPDALRWTIDAVRGFPCDAKLPATEAIIDVSSGSSGAIIVSALVPADRDALYRRWLPAFADMDEREVQLDRLMDVALP